MTPATHMVRDDAGAKALAAKGGVVVPPLYEIEVTATGLTARQMFMGWRLETIRETRTVGYIIIVSSVDGEDWEIMSEGGWGADVGTHLFDLIFNGHRHARVTARCKADNIRNIRTLKSLGFVEEGRKRLSDGDIVMFGMLRDECRLLKREAA